MRLASSSAARPGQRSTHRPPRHRCRPRRRARPPPRRSRQRRSPGGAAASVPPGQAGRSDQATVSCIVCCRAGRSRGPPPRMCRLRSTRSRSARGGSRATRAAASSMANGSPSSRRTIWTIAPASFTGSKSGRTPRARSMKRPDGRRVEQHGDLSDPPGGRLTPRPALRTSGWAVPGAARGTPVRPGLGGGHGW